MKEGILFICFILSGLAYAQEGLHFGLSLGPDKTILEKEINPAYPSNSSFKGRLSAAEVIYLEYGINDNVSFKLNLRNAAYGYDVGFNVLNVTSQGAVIHDGQTEQWRYNFLHYEASLGLRTPLIDQRLYLFQSTGIVFFPTWDLYTPESHGGLSFHKIDQLDYSSTLYINNKKKYFGLNVGLGLELRVLKKNYLTLGIYNYQGFKPVSYLVGNTTLNGQNYTNKLVSNGSYATIQFGFKRFINLKKKKLPIEQIEDDSETLIKRNRKKITLNDSAPDCFSKGNKIIGVSYRLIDKQAFYVPPFRVSVMPRFLFFIKDRFAIGPTFYYKYLKYASSFNQEVMGGFASRYYLGNSRNKIFGALDVIGGSYKDISTEFITAVVPGIGYNRTLSRSVSIENSFKYMYLINTKFHNNFLLDLGLNYHF